MKDRVVALAVTRMLSGMCTAGISLGTGIWVRPVKEFGTLTLGDLTYADRTVIRPFDVVEYSLIRHRPLPPHIEDWTCDFVHSRPVCVRRLEGDERAAFLRKSVEPDASAQFARFERSLALIGPALPTATFVLDPYSGRFDARLAAPEMGDRPIPVTDIKWRALGRKLVGGGGTVRLLPGELQAKLGLNETYVALGLSRTHEAKHWTLVVGVHTLPDYEAVVDYRAL